MTLIAIDTRTGEEVPMIPGRRRSYDIALFIRPEATVSEVHEILDELADADVYADHATAEFAAEGLFFSRPRRTAKTCWRTLSASVLSTMDS